MLASTQERHSNRVTEPIWAGGHPADQLLLLRLGQVAPLDSLGAIPS